MPYGDFLSFGKRNLNLDPSEFWLLTFAEWWPMYHSILETNPQSQKMTKADSIAMEKAWADKVAGKGQTKDGNA